MIIPVLAVAVFIGGWMMIARGLGHHAAPVHGPGAAQVLAAGDDARDRLAAADADGVLTDAEITASAGGGQVLRVQRDPGSDTHIVMMFTAPATTARAGGSPVDLCVDYYVSPGTKPRKYCTGGCPTSAHHTTPPAAAPR
ncbi:hypothetical protein [Streptomyces sp. CA-111067]|uniref:hypothetical protein n=1 Tax=Streptomyces sp. CA-111067 TaxID=3240046 RepID=UPI003D98CEA8